MTATPTKLSMDDIRDAIAMTRAHLAHDLEGRRVIADNGNAAAMLTAVTALYSALLLQACGDGAAAYLDVLSSRLLESGEALVLGGDEVA